MTSRLHRALQVGMLLAIAVLSLASVGYADITSNLVVWYTLDEGTGTSLTDNSGTGNTGALSNSPSNPSWASGASCKVNGCLSFDGTDDSATTPSHTSLNTSAFTIAAWIYLTALPAADDYDSIISRESNPVDTGYALLIGGTSGFVEFWTANGTTFTGLNGTTTIVTNTWYLVVGTYDGTTKKVYVNTTNENTTAVSYSISTDSLVAYSGKSDDISTRSVTGFIDEIRIYGRALGPIDVTELFNYPGSARRINLIFLQ